MQSQSGLSQNGYGYIYIYRVILSDQRIEKRREEKRREEKRREEKRREEKRREEGGKL
jgi:hypothetical protein